MFISVAILKPVIYKSENGLYYGNFAKHECVSKLVYNSNGILNPTFCTSTKNTESPRAILTIKI